MRAQVPPPTPVYLPFGTQHRILNNLQTALEGTCFDITLKILPEVIKAQELEAPEQLELKDWVSLSMEYADRLPCSAPMGWEGLFSAAEKLQYTITRRERADVNSIIDFLDNGIILTESFKDVRRAAWCLHVRARLQSTLASIEGFETGLRETLSVQLQNIARKRAELDTMENKAIADMMEVGKRNRVSECDIMKQALLDPNIPEEKKGLFISDGSESVKIKEEASNLQGNLGDDRISNASAADTSPKRASLPSGDSQMTSQDPVKIDQADLTNKTSWDPKSHSYSTPLKKSNVFPSLAKPQTHSYSTTFGNFGNSNPFSSLHPPQTHPYSATPKNSSIFTGLHSPPIHPYSTTLGNSNMFYGLPPPPSHSYSTPVENRNIFTCMPPPQTDPYSTTLENSGLFTGLPPPQTHPYSTPLENSGLFTGLPPPLSARTSTETSNAHTFSKPLAAETPTPGYYPGKKSCTLSQKAKLNATANANVNVNIEPNTKDDSVKPSAAAAATAAAAAAAPPSPFLFGFHESHKENNSSSFGDQARSIVRHLR